MGEKEEVIDNEFDPIIWDERGDIKLQDLPVTRIQDSLELVKVMNFMHTYSVIFNVRFKSNRNFQSQKIHCG